jgi:8-oxo-dGTP diphosphatase
MNLRESIVAERAFESLSDFLLSLEDFTWRMIYRLGFPIAKSWWFISRARHEGALVVTYVGSDFLLLRGSYRRAWNFPGGGVRVGETPEQAARRELLEETGLPAAQLQSKGEIQGFWNWRRENVHFFELHLEKLPPIKIDNREIIEARLVSPAKAATLELAGPVAAYLKGAT